MECCGQQELVLDPGYLRFDSCLHVHLNPWSLLLALTTLVAAFLDSSMFTHVTVASYRSHLLLSSRGWVQEP